MTAQYDDPVQQIPVDQINVVNTRRRNAKKFEQIVSSIRRLGLKKPITVRPASGEYGEGEYDLVCGEGRLIAFHQLNAPTIPARVQDLSNEDLLLMSLVENMARRQARSAELLGEVGALKERGYSTQDIAAKTNLDRSYVNGVLRLLSVGETSLLQAVENKKVPMSVAIQIAAADDEAVQRALREAYEKNLLRGDKLIKVRALIEARRRGSDGAPGKSSDGESLSTQKLLKAYREETSRQQNVVRQARLCQRQLVYVVTALKKLVTDDNFVNLLRAESLDTMPQFLAEEIL